ncbi:hypothetical protein [Tumebacillus flagellatus]|uniref:Uncharacterized protein n=1 Tax=Tumebacillus flagellatus TaxID=1157490 RepID=A0A074LEY9_9BACL|nr:hypothetical protein [Tumebacillus flagellatus]KEO80811.1 hypothetical protein EL26_24315 [Tumebacillus flagellatus]
MFKIDADELREIAEALEGMCQSQFGIPSENAVKIEWAADEIDRLRKEVSLSGMIEETYRDDIRIRSEWIQKQDEQIRYLTGELAKEAERTGWIGNEVQRLVNVIREAQKAESWEKCYDMLAAAIEVYDDADTDRT